VISKSESWELNLMKCIEVKEFIRRLKSIIERNPDSRFAIFIGAGCSVTSGIPTADILVKEWLKMLKKLKVGSELNYEEWAKEKYPRYDEGNLSVLYGEVIEDLFLMPDERQNEIERITEGKDPAFGYAVLAQLMSNRKYGKCFNTVITTNFDDLVADALYIYSNKKPLVIYHESLAGFVKVSRLKPLVLKLHGDARLAPKNTIVETSTIDQEVVNALNMLFHEMGLIFIGYGGNDQSIISILNDLPLATLPYGIYWVNENIPDGMKEWLERKNAIWVRHNDFDELMLFILNEIGLAHPSEERLKQIMKRYLDTFATLTNRMEAKENVSLDAVKAIEDAIEKAEVGPKEWWSVALRANYIAKKDNDEAKKIYLEGLKEFPNNSSLLESYAIFLETNLKDYYAAENYYEKALEAEPNNAGYLGNYAFFLQSIRKDYDKSEEYFKRAIKADPNHSNNLGNYALFLQNIRKDYDKSEEYFKRAVEADPNHSNNLGNYALFLQNIRKDYDKAEEYFMRAVEADPNHSNNLGNYALFLQNIRKDYDKAEEYFKRAVEADPNNANNLGSYAYLFQYIRKDYDKAEEYFMRAVEADPNHSNNLGNYALFLQNIRKDYDKAEEYFKRAVEADPNNAPNLGNYALFLQSIRKDYDKAEEYFMRAVEADPNNANNLGNYALFLQYIRKDYDKSEEYFKRAVEADPNHSNNLGNYALFLQNIRKDYDKSEEYFKRAVEAKNQIDTKEQC
jgi:tetratricopeptide (TPR) repeat protein